MNKFNFSFSKLYLLYSLFILVFTFSNGLSAKTYLVCDNITEKKQILGKIYIYLEDNEITLFKIWSDNPINNNSGFRIFPEGDRIVDKIISQTDDHIYFENNKQLDKINGIFTINMNERNIIYSYQCKNYEKKDWVLPK